MPKEELSELLSNVPKNIRQLFLEKYKEGLYTNFYAIQKELEILDDNPIDKDIVIEDVKYDRRANRLAIQHIFEHADKNVYILCGTLNEEIYCHPEILPKISTWLNQEADRVLHIITRDPAFNIKTSSFYEIFDYVSKSNIQVQSIGDQSGWEKYNFLVNDTGGMKIKEISSEEEKLVINYKDTENSNKLIKSFESMSSDNTQIDNETTEPCKLASKVASIIISGIGRTSRITPKGTDVSKILAGA